MPLWLAIQGATYPQADANVREQRFQARVMQLVQQLQRGHLYVSKIGMLPSIAGSALLADCSLVSAGAGQLLKASSPLCTVSTWEEEPPVHAHVQVSRSVTVAASGRTVRVASSVWFWVDVTDVHVSKDEDSDAWKKES